MSYDSRKSDASLGALVHAHLLEKNLETPTVENNLDANTKITKIEHHMTRIMETLGLDLRDDSLVETPKRVAKMYVNEIFYGLDYDKFPKITCVDNKFDCDEMVLETGVNLQSTCEHHFLSIDGKCAIAYIPNKKVIGLSKMNRLAEFFAKRPQIQERLTNQIHEALCFILETKDVAVIIKGQHLCVKTRGIEDTGSSTVTSRLSGTFKEVPAARAEFMALVNGSLE